MDDKADPANGWAISSIQQCTSLASADWYGKLYTFLNVVLRRFIERLGNLQIHFALFNVDVQDLPRYLDDQKFSRIEVSWQTRR